MGRNKLLLTVGGQPVVRRSVARAVAAGLDPVIVVLGHEAADAARQLAGLPCRPLLHPDYERGMASSLRAGIGTLPPDATGAVIMLADMPFVTTDMVTTLVRRYRTTGAPLVVSDYAGVVAPPVLYARALFTELLTLDGDGCGKQVIRRHRSEAVVVSWPAPRLADLDTPADYERVTAHADPD
jgi:molybdenum cofactor cytidylyltransferase